MLLRRTPECANTGTVTSSACLLLLLLSAALPLEDEPAWRDGMQLLDEFRYEEALERLRPLADDDERPAAERARVHVRSGMIHADLRREAEARRHFRSALALDASASLPAGSSPRLLALFESVRRSMPSPADAAAASPPSSSPAPDSAAGIGAADGRVPPHAAQGAGGTDAAAAEALSATDVALWSLTAAGALLVVGGAAAWGSGLGLYALADGAHFQQDAASLGEAGAWSQIAGQGALAAGALVVAGGALLLSVEP